MDDRIQYKMFNLEVAPPENAWDNIESVLNNQQAVSLIQRFNELEITPAYSAWPAIEAELDGKIVRPARLIPFNLRRLAAAAAIIGVISTAAWLMSQGSKDSSVPARSVTASFFPVSPLPAKPFKPSNPNASPAARVERITASAPVIRLSQKLSEGAQYTSVQNTRNIEPLDPSRSGPQHQIAVSAPLIVGSDGKPYADYQLLVSSDKNYISITSPNGAQTRISAKFLPVLSYLNDHGSTAKEGVEWVAKFQQWKKRLLEDPDFIPSAGNFLDLPELTDVFQEQ